MARARARGAGGQPAAWPAWRCAIALHALLFLTWAGAAEPFAGLGSLFSYQQSGCGSGLASYFGGCWQLSSAGGYYPYGSDGEGQESETADVYLDSSPADGVATAASMSSNSSSRENVTLAEFIADVPQLVPGAAGNSSNSTLLADNMSAPVYYLDESFLRGMEGCASQFENLSVSLDDLTDIDKYDFTYAMMQDLLVCLANLTENVSASSNVSSVDGMFQLLSHGLNQILFDPGENFPEPFEADVIRSKAFANDGSPAANESLSDGGEDTSGTYRGRVDNETISNDNDASFDSIDPRYMQALDSAGGVGFGESSGVNSTKEKGSSNDREMVAYPLPGSPGRATPLSVGAIAGIAVTCTSVVLILAGVAAFYLYTKNASNSSSLSFYDDLLTRKSQSNHPAGPNSGVDMSALSSEPSSPQSSRANNAGFLSFFQARWKKPSLMTLPLENSLVSESSPVQDGVDFMIPANEVSLHEVIGRGAFGVVYKGHWREKEVAVKMLSIAYGNDEKLLKTFKKEVDVLSRLHHDNVVNLHGACFAPPNVFIVEEYVKHGSLHDALHKHNSEFSYAKVVQVALDIACALAYLHPKIVHCDLKPQNVLLGENDRAQVADFGVSKFKNGTYMHQTSAAAMNGTTAYMAPELFSAGHVSEKCDIYSLGVVLWECLTRKEPWKGMEFPAQVVMAVAVEMKRPEIPEDCPLPLKRLITKCWSEEPHRRPSALEVVKECGFILQELEGVTSTSEEKG